jgi:hypothetical protein
MKLKRGMLFWDTTLGWIIMIGVVILVLFLYLTLSGKLDSMGEFIKNFLRFGR